jgi:hypothetical protein
MIQDFTIFSPDNDLVPLLGTADGSGNVTQATFSTDPTHPRPYMKLVENVGESTIDFLKGSSVIGQMQVPIVDKRRFVTDKTSGLLTYYLADGTGDTQLLGCRGVMRQQNTRGTMEVIFDGVIGTVSLDTNTFVTYTIQLRDARERERKLRAFDFATTTCFFPRVGPANGWGYPARYSSVIGKLEPFYEPVMPAIAGELMQYKAVPGGGLFTAQQDKASVERMVALTAKWQSVWQNYGEAFWIPAALSGSILDAWSHQSMLLDWRADNSTVWHQANVPTVTTFISSLPDGGTNAFNVQPVSEKDQRPVLKSITFEQDGTTTLPADGQFVFVRARSNREPTSDVPLYVEENFGLLLRDIYDGHYSSGLVMPVRYDAAAMSAMEKDTTLARAKIEGPVEDAREWVQENIYKICGYAPAARNGLVIPIKYEIPDPSLPLLSLDDSNLISATWQHGPDNVVNEVVIEYERDMVPPNLADGLVDVDTQKAIIQRDRINSQSRNGSKPLTYKPVTLRAIGPKNPAFAQSVSDDIGTTLGLKRAEEVLRRFTFGAQVCEVEVLLDATTEAALEGDWCVLAASWLPDYVSKQRGMSRLMQITKVSRIAPHKRGFSLLDAGPYDVPVGVPTVGTITENADRSVSVEITGVPAGGKVEVQYALGATVPPATSGAWQLMSVPYGVISSDPYTADPTKWTGVSVAAVSDGLAGGFELKSAPGAYNAGIAVDLINIDLTKRYRVHAKIRRNAAADGTVYIGVQVQDAAGALIAGNGTYWYVGAVADRPTAGVWTDYEGYLGPGGLMGGFPSNAVRMGLIALMNYVAPTGGSYEIQDFYISEQLSRVVRTPPNIPPGTNVWFRARGVADGRRSSAWIGTGTLSHTMALTPIMRDFKLSIGDVSDVANYGHPLIQWERLPSAVGLRVLYKTFAKGATPPVPDSVFTGWSFFDVDMSAGGTVVDAIGRAFLPIALHQWEQIAVVLHPFSGFSGGAVTGVQGASSVLKTTQRHDAVTQLPMVRVSTTEAATLGTVSMDIYDPSLALRDVEFYTQNGNGAPSAWISTPVTQVAPNEFTVASNVGLAEGQTSFIGYRITAYDADGNSVNVQQDVAPFAQGDFPVLIDVDMAVDPATGATNVSWVGDSNTASVKFVVNTTGFVSAATVRLTGVLANGRSGFVAVFTASPGQTVYLSVLGYSGAGATGLETTQLYQYQEARPILTGTIPPGIQETTVETATGTVPMVGSLTINVTDPQLRVTGVRFRTQTGNGAWSALSTFAAAPASWTVFMVEGHVSKIEYEVWADMGAGSVLYYRGSVAFSTGSIPGPPQLVPSFDDNGSLRVLVMGDSDTASIRLGASTISVSAAASNAAAATPVTGRVLEYTNVLVGITSGQLVYVVAYAYPAAGGVGQISAPAQANLSREGGGTQTPTGPIGKSIKFRGTYFNESPSWAGVDSRGRFLFSEAGAQNIQHYPTTSQHAHIIGWTVLPPGVTITAIHFNWLPSNDTAVPTSVNMMWVTLYRVLPDGGGYLTVASTGSDSSGPTTTWRTKNAFISATAPSDPIIIDVEAGPGTLLNYVEIEYSMPSYDKTI